MKEFIVKSKFDDMDEVDIKYCYFSPNDLEITPNDWRDWETDPPPKGLDCLVTRHQRGKIWIDIHMAGSEYDADLIVTWKPLPKPSIVRHLRDMSRLDREAKKKGFKYRLMNVKGEQCYSVNDKSDELQGYYEAIEL